MLHRQCGPREWLGRISNAAFLYIRHTFLPCKKGTLACLHQYKSFIFITIQIAVKLL